MINMLHIIVQRMMMKNISKEKMNLRRMVILGAMQCISGKGQVKGKVKGK